MRLEVPGFTAKLYLHTVSYSSENAGLDTSTSSEGTPPLGLRSHRVQASPPQDAYSRWKVVQLEGRPPLDRIPPL